MSDIETMKEIFKILTIPTDSDTEEKLEEFLEIQEQIKEE